MATTLEELEIAFKADISGLRGDLKKVEDAINKTGKSVDKVGAKISTAFKTVIAGAVGFAATKFYDLVKASEDEALALIATAQAANVGTEELQRLRFAAEGVGASARDMDEILVRLNKRLGEARAGSKDASREFKLLGLDALVRNGASTETVLRGLSDALAQVDDPAKADAIALKVLGQNAAQLTGLLRGGSDALGEWARGADEVGVQSRAMTKELAAAARETRALNKWVKGFAADVDLILIRTLRGAVGAIEDLGEAMRDFRRENERQRNQGFLGSTTTQLLEDVRNFGKVPGAPKINFEAIDLGPTKKKPRKVGDVNSFFERSGSSKREAERIQEVIASLRLEKSAFEQTAVQQRIDEELKSAGITASSKYAATISALVVEIDKLTTAQKAQFLEQGASAQIFADAQGVYAATRTEAERLADEMLRLNQMMEFGALDAETYDRAVQQLQGTYVDWSQAYNEVGDLVASSFADAAVRGEELSDVLGHLAEQLAELVFQKLVFDQLSNAVSAGISGIVGGFAAGGELNPGNAYQVHRDEVLVPKVPTSVIPKRHLGGGMSISFAPSYSIASGVNAVQVRAMVEQANASMLQRLPQIINEQASRGRLRLNG